jgi:hypothetical protein
MDPNLDDLVRRSGEFARDILIDEGRKQLSATFLLFGADDRLHVVPCFWENEIQKQLMIAKIREIARTVGAVALSFMSEAWLSTQPNKAGFDRTPPSEDPNRREIVFAVAANKEHRIVRHWQIIRNRPGGRIISLVEDPIPSGMTFAGRMIDGILP